MTEKEQTLADLAAAMAEADPADQPRFAAAITFVETLPDDSPLFAHYRPAGRALWLPPEQPPQG